METLTELIFLFYLFCFLICMVLVTLLNLFMKKHTKIDNNRYEDSFIARV